MSILTFYVAVVQALEEIKAPYMIVGAFAGLAFGVSRATFDIDILVDLRPKDTEKLASRFPLPRYYADPVMMRNSIRQGIMFNLVDTQEGIKADMVPLTRAPGYKDAFTRRIRQAFTDDEGNAFEAWCAQPTDIIIGKLKAWTDGRSNKHPTDIHNMLVFSLSGLGGEEIDLALVTAEAVRLGSDTQALWQELVARARSKVQRDHNT
jgi:hypothetical protein